MKKVLIVLLLILILICGCQSALDAEITARRKMEERSFVFNGVSVLDENKVWAVGSKGNIWFYNGSEWNQQESGIESDLHDVFVFDSNHVWAVGDKGTILFYDGSKWQQQKSRDEKLNGIFALNPQNVWSVGEGIILYYNGINWKKQYDVPLNLVSVSATSDSDVWAVGENMVLRYDGMWKEYAELSFTLNDISINKGNVYVAGYKLNKSKGQYDSSIIRLDDNKWKEVHMIPNYSKPSLSISESKIWMTGNTKTITHYNGSEWTSFETSPFVKFHDISSFNGKAWAVGQKADALRVNTEIAYFYNGKWSKSK